MSKLTHTFLQKRKVDIFRTPPRSAKGLLMDSDAARSGVASAGSSRWGRGTGTHIESATNLLCRRGRLHVRMGRGVSLSNAWHFYTEKRAWQLFTLANFLPHGAWRMPLLLCRRAH